MSVWTPKRRELRMHCFLTLVRADSFDSFPRYLKYKHAYAALDNENDQKKLPVLQQQVYHDIFFIRIFILFCLFRFNLLQIIIRTITRQSANLNHKNQFKLKELFSTKKSSKISLKTNLGLGVLGFWGFGVVARVPKFCYGAVIIRSRLRLQPENPNPDPIFPFQNYH